jgi:hypothetical protein
MQDVYAPRRWEFPKKLMGTWFPLVPLALFEGKTPYRP